MQPVDTSSARNAILDDVNMMVATGERVAVIGPSGAGKSTLLATLAGLERPNRGTIHIGRSMVRHEGRPPAGFGIVLQSYGLLSLLTPAENVDLTCRRGAYGRPASGPPLPPNPLPSPRSSTSIRNSVSMPATGSGAR